MRNYYYILAWFLVFGFAANAQNNDSLKFNGNGEFKIAQFTDTHINLLSKNNLNSFETMRVVVEIEKPDFVILTGDIVTQDNPQEAYHRIAVIFKEANVPWSMIFGNHDSEHNL